MSDVVAMPSHPPARLHDVKEAAVMLRLTPATVWDLIRRGRLRTVREGRRRLVPPEYIEEYVALLKREAETTV